MSSIRADLTLLSFDELRDELERVLNKNPIDLDQIQTITSELLKRDTQNVRFSTDAGIIARLGQELVGRQETAVAELVKNAYDADATEVNLVFYNSFEQGGNLVIQDNGMGMNWDQIIAGFMRLSSNDKVSNPISVRYGRRRAGRKGIGRFAVQRLGLKLEITTQTLESDTALKMIIDWEVFQPGSNLESISNKISTVAKDRPEGTTLLIKGLRDSWSDAAQRRVYRYVSELLQPKLDKVIPSAKREEEEQHTPKDSLPDPGFSVSLNRIHFDEQEEIASQDKTIFSNALAVIDSYVDNKGEGVWVINSPQLDISNEIYPIGKDRDKHNIPFTFLKKVSLKAYYYIWSPADLIPKSVYKTLFDLARQSGGVKVYRNGFRVSPYGDRENDWLGLDASYATRRLLPPHSNQNFFGFVELSDPDGEYFQERSSREGLIENDAFLELRDFSYRVLTAAVLRIAEERQKKSKASQKDWTKRNDEANPSAFSASPIDTLDLAMKELRDVVNQAKMIEASKSTSEKNMDSPKETLLDSILDKASMIEAAVDDVRNETQIKEEVFLEEAGMLRVLASLGLVIGEFTHEVRQTLGAAQGNADDLARKLSPTMAEKTIAQHLAQNVKRFWDYAGYFDRTVSDNATRQLESHDLRIVCRQFVKAMEPAAKRVGIDLNFDPRGYELLTPPMHASEINSILFNFYSNSLKAIKRSGNSRGKLLIKVGLENRVVYLEFSDNGDGIPDEIKPRIFNAFFTTSTPASRDQPIEEESQGSGLGLKIVQDIVTSYNGEVFLSEPQNGYSTCFRVELPFNRIDENG